MAEAVRYSEALTIRCQAEMVASVEKAAQREGMKPSEYVRRSIVDRLRADGLGPAFAHPPEAPPSEGGESFDDGAFA